MLTDAQRRAIIERITPIPVVGTLGLRIETLDDGFCSALVPHKRQYDGIYGSMHGGMLMMIADSVACFAIMTVTGPDQAMTTTDMNIRFLAPCLSDVRADARVIKVGRTLCPVGVDLFDDNDRRVAVAQVTYIRLDSEPNRSERHR